MAPPRAAAAGARARSPRRAPAAPASRRATATAAPAMAGCAVPRRPTCAGRRAVRGHGVPERRLRHPGQQLPHRLGLRSQRARARPMLRTPTESRTAGNPQATVTTTHALLPPDRAAHLHRPARHRLQQTCLGRNPEPGQHADLPRVQPGQRHQRPRHRALRAVIQRAPASPFGRREVQRFHESVACGEKNCPAGNHSDVASLLRRSGAHAARPAPNRRRHDDALLITAAPIRTLPRRMRPPTRSSSPRT